MPEELEIEADQLNERIDEELACEGGALLDEQRDWFGHQQYRTRVSHIVLFYGLGNSACHLSSSPSQIASPGSAATNISTQLRWVPGRISCCMKCCRRSSSGSNVVVPGAAACSARALAVMARSHTRCATPTSGRPR